MATGKRKKRGLEDLFDGDLSSFIADIENNTPESSQVTVSINDLHPNPYQPRRVFDEEKLNELSASIKQHGIFTPLILKKTIHGYDIVAGERRFRAAKKAGIEEVPAIIMDFSDEQMMEIALLENIQREDLNAIEEAQAYRNLMDKLNLTQEEMAERLGKSRAHIANTLRLLQLPEQLQNYVLENKLTMGHVRPLITLKSDKALEIAKRAIDENLSVRNVENIVKGLQLQEARKSKPKVPVEKTYKYAEDIVRKKFRTKVKIDDHTITFKYTDMNDLNRLLELMGVIEED